MVDPELLIWPSRSRTRCEANNVFFLLGQAFLNAHLQDWLGLTWIKYLFDYFFFFFSFIASSWLFCLFWDKLDRYSSKQSTCSKPPCFFSFMHTTTSSFKYNQQVFQSETNAKQCWGSVFLKDTVVEAQGHNFWRLWRNKPSTSWSRVQCFITALQLTLQTSWLLPSRKTGFAPQWSRKLTVIENFEGLLRVKYSSHIEKIRNSGDFILKG